MVVVGVVLGVGVVIKRVMVVVVEVVLMMMMVTVVVIFRASNPCVMYSEVWGR